MRFLPFLIALGTPVWAAPIITAPINVTGSGSFDSVPLGIFGGFELKFSFAGTNGTDSVSISVETSNGVNGEIAPDALPAVFTSGFPLWFGSATVDGISGSTDIPGENHAGFTFQNGGGLIEISDLNANLLAEATVIGYIDITSETKTYGPFPPLGLTNTLLEVTDTFDIVPTPEPSALVFLAAAFSAIALSRLRSGSKRRLG